jgi:F-type H+-transporting ATPase subunit epsilon
VSGGHLHLRVVSPERVVLETEADSLSLPGALGQLGILPGHAHLITALRTGVLETRRGNAVRKVAVFGGFAEVGDDTVTVLADGAALPDDIDLAAAHADKTAAEEALKHAGSEEISALRERIDAAEARIATARAH